MTNLTFPLLGAVFGNLGGEVKFSAEDQELTSRDPDSIEAFIDAAKSETDFGEVYVALATTTGEVAGRSFVFESEEQANEFAVEHGKPSICFAYDDEVRWLFYAWDQDITIQSDNERDVIPLPVAGWSIYDGSIEYVLATPQEPTEGVEEPDTDEAATEAEPAPSDAPAYPMTLNAATVRGPIADNALTLEFKLGFGKNRHDKKWPAKAMTYGGLVQSLSKHAVGTKDGPAFLQGSAIGNERKAPAIDALYIMGIDVDSGIFPEQAIKKVESLGLTAIIYTTHSHMKTSTFLVENSYNQFCKKQKLSNDVEIETVRRFLVEERMWEQWVADTVEIGEVTQTAEGKGYWLSHNPMPKFRIVFPLNAPYVIAKQKMSQIDAIKLWKAKLVGLANTLVLPLDESCLDPSRLFYLPRHDKNGQFGVWVTGGAPLDFDAIVEGKVRGRHGQVQTEDNVFMQAADDLAAKTENPLVIDGDFSLKRWAREVSHDFDIAQMFRSVAPDKIRDDQNTTKLSVTCPFDHNHSNAGDPDDKGCYVQSPEPEMGLNSFVFACSHNSCKGRDRLEMVAQAVEHGWFGREDLSNNDFRQFTMEEQTAFVDVSRLIDDAVDLISAIDVADVRSIQRQTEKQVSLLVQAGASDADIIMFTDALKRLKLVTTQFVKELTQNARKRYMDSLTPEQREAVNRSRSGNLSLNGCRPLYMGPDTGYIEQRNAVRDTLTLINRRDTRIFNYGGVKFSVETMVGHDDVAVSALSLEHMANKLSDKGGIVFMRPSDDSFMSIPIPERILNEMLVNEEWHCPTLTAFSELPYFNSEHKLIQRQGYDPISQMYLKPSSLNLVVPPNATKEDAIKARDFILQETFGDFPFDDGPEEEHQASKGASSRSHFMTLLLQPFIRELIKGPTPIYLVSKPTAGTGASLLLSCSMFITSGKAAKTATHKFSEEEQRKEITSAFVAAKTYFLIDNIRHEINSAAYCNLATSTVWEDRLLGASKMASYPNRMQFIIAGNNPRGTYEIMRRCLPIRLDAKIDPRKREAGSFKHQNLEEFVHNNQKELVEAILTIIQAWINSGAEIYKDKPLMSFESWSQVMGGILKFVELPGFLENLHLAQKHANDESSAFEMFYQFLATGIDGLNKPFTLRQVADIYVAGDEEFPQIGARYNDQSQQLAVNLDRVLKEKIGAPYDIVVNGEHMTVKLTRIMNADGQKTNQFQLARM